MSRYPGRILSSTAPTVNANTAKGIWTLDEALRYSRAGQWPVPTGGGDPFFQYNTMLLPGQGTNGAQNNTFLDSSTNNFTITRNGNTTQGTFTPFSGANGNWSNFFDGNGDFLSMTGSSATNFNGTDWTIECWFYKTALSGGNENLIQSTTGTNAWVPYLALGLNNNQTIGVALNAVGYSSTQTYSLNSWNHVAVVRNGGVVSVYLNGVATSISVTVDIPSSNLSFWIGKVDNAPGGGGYLYYFNGFLSNLRVVKGTAVYTSAFTPPTAPLTAITNTSLLTCQSNRFIDNSTNAFAITPSGNTAVTPFQPFGAPTSAYSASTIGGSGYFDGSGDYLTAPSTSGQFGSGDFTVEAWIYPIARTNSFPTIFNNYTSYAAGSLGLFAGHGSGTTTKYQVAINGATFPVIESTATIAYNSWTHLAVVRSSGVITLYVNGAANGTYSTGATLNGTAGASWIGTSGDSLSSGAFHGYISGFRSVPGTAVYTAAFTPPTAPLTAITNTSLLLSGTNGGIIDNAQDNNLETVGNAQISTTQYKWGASSMYFDGNGDNLSGPSTPALNCGTGDFTIEGWVYVSSRTLNYPLIFGNNNGSYTAGALALVNSSANNAAYNDKFCLNAYDINSSGAPALVSSSTNALNTWYHLALVRVGTTLKMFVNGNQTASATISASVVFNWGKGGVFVGGGNWDTTNSYFNGYINDLRLTNGYARYPYNFTAPTAALPLFWQAAATPSSDPYFDYTTLLLPGNGTNGANNNTFLDSSTNAFTITRNGNTTQGTFTPFSQTGWGNFFDGTSGQYLNTVANTAFNFGTSDFTIEGWVYPTGTNASAPMPIVEIRSSPTNTSGFVVMRAANSLKLNVYSNGYLGESTNSLTLNQWNHVALTRNSNTWTYWINGLSSGSFTNSSNQTDGATTGPKIGGSSTAGEVWIGYLSNIRVTKGAALYTSNFIPSTTPLTTTVSSGTVSLLTCQSNRFVDSSANAFAITVNGSPSVQAFSPFNPTAAYSTSTVGGSGYFDGTGDFLSVTNNAAFNFGSGAFTIEFWYYPTTLSGTQCLITNYGGSTTGFVIQMGGSTAGSGKIDAGFSGDGADITSTNAVKLNSWNHIAISGTPGATGIKLFINGAQEGSTYTGATSLDTSSTLLIGEVVSTNRLSGYLSGLRLLKGTAQYTTTFTPPTAPPTAITNTSLLCNFTNGGIIDNTAKNNLETVGGASISTTVSKFGGSSMYFDGAGDSLIVPNSQNFDFGSGDFTVEVWVYPTASGAYKGIFTKRESSANYSPVQVLINSGTMALFVSTSGSSWAINTNASSSPALNTWSHIAVCRYGGTITLYLNGAPVASGSVSTSSLMTNTARFVFGSESATDSGNYAGYMQDARVTKGIARYTTNFTPPTTAFLTL